MKNSTEPERDKHLIDKLKLELPGILNWAIDGLRDWKEKGLAFPNEVKTATDSYRQEMDIISGFLADCCLIREDAEVRSKNLYEAYLEWCENNGEKAISQTALGLKFVERGFEKKKFSGGFNGWKGIGLLRVDS